MTGGEGGQVHGQQPHEDVYQTRHGVGGGGSVVGVGVLVSLGRPSQSCAVVLW